MKFQSSKLFHQNILLNLCRGEKKAKPNLKSDFNFLCLQLQVSIRVSNEDLTYQMPWNDNGLNLRKTGGGKKQVSSSSTKYQMLSDAQCEFDSQNHLL